MTIPTIEFTLPMTEALGKMTVRQRRGMLKNFLAAYSEMEMISPKLGKVYISPRGIKETAEHASRSVESTIAAMNMRSVVENAILIARHTPKQNQQVKRFGFVEICELAVKMRGVGDVKLMVGRMGNNFYVEYCITVKRK